MTPIYDPATRELVRLDYDINGDGRIDVRTYMAGGRPVRLEGGAQGLVQDLAVALRHGGEVDHDLPSKAAQAEVAGKLAGVLNAEKLVMMTNIPGVFVASSEFVDAAIAQSASLGFPDVARVFTPHPIQDRTDDEMRANPQLRTALGNQTIMTLLIRFFLALVVAIGVALTSGRSRPAARLRP